MRAIALRLAVVGLTNLLAFMPVLSASAVDAPTDPAVQAYVARQQADQQQALDKIVSGKMDALVNDPASPVIGDPQAPVAIVEFFDYACPFCKATEPRLEALLKADKGVKLTLKEFPILTPESMIAARASLASAKQGKYEQFHNALMGYKGRLQEAVIFDTAKSVGLDMDRLRKDMDSTDITNEIIANFNLARGLRIVQTPGYIVGDHILTGAIVGNHIVSGASADIDFPKEVAAARSK